MVLVACPQVPPGAPIGAIWRREDPLSEPFRHAGRGRHAWGLMIAEMCMPCNLRRLFVRLKGLRHFPAECRRGHSRWVRGGSEVGENRPCARRCRFPVHFDATFPQEEIRKDRQCSGRNTSQTVRGGSHYELPGGEGRWWSCRLRRSSPPLHDTRRGGGGRRNGCPGVPDGGSNLTQTAQNSAITEIVPIPASRPSPHICPEAKSHRVGWVRSLPARFRSESSSAKAVNRTDAGDHRPLPFRLCGSTRRERRAPRRRAARRWRSWGRHRPVRGGRPGTAQAR